jgi:cytochrome c peroxidase
MASRSERPVLGGTNGTETGRAAYGEQSSDEEGVLGTRESIGRSRRRAGLVAGGILMIVLAVALALGVGRGPSLPEFSEEELATLRSLALSELGPVQDDPTNRVADDPAAAALGHDLFFDTRFSTNGSVACGTCHVPDLSFTDGLPTGVGVGRMPRKTMNLVATAYDQWLFWDGRKDSQWAQALAPLESLVEHGGTRTMYARLVAEHYREPYEAIFGPLPDFSDATRFPGLAGPNGDAAAAAAWGAMAPADQDAVTTVFVNMGKAIAAFERLLVPTPSRFDAYAAAVLEGDAAGATVLSADEVAGLQLFIGRAGCTTCHRGPRFTNGEFHNTGVPRVPNAAPDTGRAAGAHLVLNDEFNCRSRWSDAQPPDCPHLDFLRIDDHGLTGMFKAPTLRNVALTAPYMDAGQFATLDEVLAHYNTAPQDELGHSELQPLGLTDAELRQLVAFLQTLTGPAEMPDFPSPSTED